MVCKAIYAIKILSFGRKIQVNVNCSLGIEALRFCTTIKTLRFCTAIETLRFCTTSHSRGTFYKPVRFVILEYLGTKCPNISFTQLSSARFLNGYYIIDWLQNYKLLRRSWSLTNLKTFL